LFNADAAMHVPLLQLAPAAHARPHIPQLVALVLRLVSQPLAALPSQSPKPALQLSPHAPAAHVAVALAPAAHILPHIPQFAALVRRSISQPLTALPSQLPKPS
jgi:hypothetical protein